MRSLRFTFLVLVALLFIGAVVISTSSSVNAAATRQGDITVAAPASSSANVDSPKEPLSDPASVAREQKRIEKKIAARNASQKAAQQRAHQLSARRQAQKTKQAKARSSAAAKADALLAKKREADTPGMRTIVSDKLNWLMKRTTESSNRMVALDTTQFNTYIAEGPRPYHMMLSFTALTGQHNCFYCHQAQNALLPVAAAHYERTRSQTEAVLKSNSTADIPESDLPVFFVTIDMAKNPILFKELKLAQAPALMLAPPRLGTSVLKPNAFMASIGPKYRFNLQPNMGPNDFTSFINKLAGCHVNLDAAKPGFAQVMVMMIVLLAGAVVGVRYGYEILLVLRSIRGVKYVVLVVGCGLYCWCIGGGMYNIIRGTHWSGGGRDGTTNYINGDARDQFAAEGFIIGGLNLACAVALVLLNTRAFDDNSSAHAASGARKNPLSATITQIKTAVSPFISPIVCLAMLVSVWFQIIDIYSRKNYGYRRGFVWRI